MPAGSGMGSQENTKAMGGMKGLLISVEQQREQFDQ